MIRYRGKAFETNSSSSHTFALTAVEEFNRWKNYEIFKDECHFVDKDDNTDPYLFIPILELKKYIYAHKDHVRKMCWMALGDTMEYGNCTDEQLQEVFEERQSNAMEQLERFERGEIQADNEDLIRALRSIRIYDSNWFYSRIYKIRNNNDDYIEVVAYGGYGYEYHY